MTITKEIGRYHNFPVSLVGVIVKRNWFYGLFGSHALAVLTNGAKFSLTKAETDLLLEEIEIYKGCLQVSSMITNLQAANRPSK